MGSRYISTMLIIILLHGCSGFVNLRQMLIEDNDKLIGRNFDQLVQRDAEATKGLHAGILHGDTEPTLKMRVVSESANAIHYEIVWRRTCKYIVIVDKRTHVIQDWYFDSKDHTYCYANP